jgi:hypothetical protein
MLNQTPWKLLHKSEDYCESKPGPTHPCHLFTDELGLESIFNTEAYAALVFNFSEMETLAYQGAGPTEKQNISNLVVKVPTTTIRVKRE